jgi:hypothetical protein
MPPPIAVSMDAFSCLSLFHSQTGSLRKSIPYSGPLEIPVPVTGPFILMPSSPCFVHDD